MNGRVVIFGAKGWSLNVWSNGKLIQSEHTVPRGKKETE